MGYYTSHFLEVAGFESEDEFRKLRQIMTSDIKLIHYALDEGQFFREDKTAIFYSWEPVKWYTHEEDMLVLSKLIPHLTFKLSGDGEDPGDLWFALYQNGQAEVCHAHIVYDKPKIIAWPPKEGVTSGRSTV